MTKIDKTDIDNIKVILNETKINNVWPDQGHHESCLLYTSPSPRDS